LKKALSILLVAALIIPSLTRIGILVDFKINQDFIAEFLCINKDDIASSCNGKCYLSQKLQEAEEQEQKQIPASKTERLEVVYYFSDIAYDGLENTLDTSDKLEHAFINEFHPTSFVIKLLRPPKFI
jgi:hypothetical protein